MPDQTHLLAVFGIGEQRLAQPPLVGRDHTGCRRQNMRRRPVVLLQLDHGRTGKVRLEPQDIAHLGPAPAIDALVVVADAADILVRRRQQPQPQILRDVGILIFVHQNEFEPLLVLLQHIRMGLENRHYMQQQIAEVAGIQIKKPPLITRIKIDRLVIEGPRIRQRHLVRPQRTVLPRIDDPGQHPGRPALLVDPGGDDQLLHQPLLVVRIQNREIRLQPHQFRVTPQQLHTDRMKGAKPRHPLHCLTHQAAHAVFHLARGLVGESHRQHLVRPGRSRCQQMRNSCGQGAGLSGARPRQHQDRPLQGFNRRALRRIQTIKVRPCTGPCHRTLA